MQIVKLFFVLISLSAYCATNSQASDFIEREVFISPSERTHPLHTMAGIVVKIPVANTNGQKERLQRLEQTWERNKPSKLTPLQHPTIPKILHQIWLGPQPLPAKFAAYAQECKALHPDWEYKLWTDENIKNEQLPLQELTASALSYQEKANIIRATLLEKYGGIYIDTDTLCLKPYDELRNYYDFVGGMEWNVFFAWRPVLNNAFIASAAHHPILKAYIKNLPINWQKNHETYSQQQLETNNDPIIISLMNSFPLYTNTIYQYLSQNTQDKRSIILPPHYFFPVLLKYARDSKFDVNQYSFSVHDYRKDMRLIKFLPLEFAFDLSQQITKHYMLKQKYRKFTKADYRPNTIPKTMHFVHMLEGDLSPQWKEGMYRTWQQKFWNKDDIYSIANKAEKSLLNRTNSEKAFELLSGLIILNKLGGVYLDNKAVPGKENFFDLIYSLDFFAGLTKMETENPTASYKAIGVKPQHKITMRILKTLQNTKGTISLATLQDIILQKGYEYINIDGLNTFLPQQYFEPQENEEYSILK